MSFQSLYLRSTGDEKSQRATFDVLCLRYNTEKGLDVWNIVMTLLVSLALTFVQGVDYNHNWVLKL